MKVVSYIRVSASEQASNGDSLDTQRRQVIGYAMMKSLDVDEVFVEAGVSGSVPLAERPEGARMLADIGKGVTRLSPRSWTACCATPPTPLARWKR